MTVGDSDVAWEGTPEVTTSLRPQATKLPRAGRHRVGDPIDEPAVAPKHNGVPRSSWYRAVRRVSTWHRPYALALIAIDVVATLLASYTAVSAFAQADAGFQHAPTAFRLVAYLLLPAAWLVALWSHGAYDRRYLGVGTEEFKRVFRASITIAASVSFLAFAFKIDLSRLSVATALVGALSYLVVGRFVARRALILVRGKGRAVHRVLLVGSFVEALDVHAAVTRAPSAGLVPVGIALTEGFAASRGAPSPVPVHTGRDILSLVRELGADTIAICGSANTEPGELRRLAWQLEGTGIDLVVAPQLTDIAGPRVHIRPVEGLPLLHVEEPKLSGLAWLIKNFMDRVVAVMLLLVLLPVFAVISVLIWLSDRGPVYFSQPRVGREGTTFTVWKFRTMYTDAEDRQAQLSDRNEGDGLLFKIRNDPRVIPVGRFLRKTSLDELPQLLNVVKGEMSLVGPRPLPADDGDFLGDVRRRLLVRPGMTGLWQVSGRSELSWDDAVRLDLYYVDNWSLAFDIVILWRTIGVVFRRKGAY
jgi:exopolysaccharide biosynthesis polyprenyl glycosylphosphotransferase